MFNNEDSSVLEASGGRSIVRTVTDLGMALALVAALGKFSWDVKNEYQKRSSPYGDLKGKTEDLFRDNISQCNDGLYRTMVRKTANKIKELIN